MRSNDHAAAMVGSGDRIHVGLSHTPLTGQDISTAGAEEPSRAPHDRLPVAVFLSLCGRVTKAGEMHRYLSEPGRVPKDEE